MSSAECWRLTPREFQAREKVFESYLGREARLLATIANAPHFHRSDKKPYGAEDFLSTAEAAAKREERKKDALDLAMMQARLARITKDKQPEGLPAWAVGPYWKDAMRANG